MRLSNKLLACLGMIWVIFLAITYFGSQQFLMKGFLKLEQEQINKNISRVQQAIDEELYSLGALTTDWSHWNDAYDFIKGINPAFIPNNIDIIALVNSKLNLMIYLKNPGKILIALAVNLESKKFVALPPGIEKYIFPNSTLEHHKTISSFNTGLMILPSGIMLAASSGLSNTDLSAPIIGTMITGRYLSKKMLDKFSENTNLQLVLYVPEQINATPSLKNVFDTMVKGKTKNQTEILNDKMAYGYLLLTDLNQMPIGMIQIANPRAIYQTGGDTITYYLGVYLLSGIMLLLVIWYLFRMLVLNRLEYLNQEIQNISSKKDYARRINLTNDDELTSVANQFNTMMSTIEVSHDQLENQVNELSISEKRLEKTNEQLLKEINERKLAEEKVNLLHHKLILAARRAGMADIASGVLHNIGNILNSVETSIAMTREKSEQTKAESLFKITQLINEHQDHLDDFFKNNKKGQKVLSFLAMLAESWKEENQYVLFEIDNLNKNVGHIKNVVVMQQSLSTTIAMTEEIDLVDLIEDALVLNKAIYVNANIEIIRDYTFTDRVEVDRVKLLHILVNLIKNAIDSLLQSEQKTKILKIVTKKTKKDEFTIVITDNGLGIESQNITKIFSYGFTTKKSGHGFGLHTSSTFVQEMMGSLVATSAGENRGATFTIVLPVKAASKREFTDEPGFEIDKE